MRYKLGLLVILIIAMVIVSGCGLTPGQSIAGEASRRGLDKNVRVAPIKTAQTDIAKDIAKQVADTNFPVKDIVNIGEENKQPPSKVGGLNAECTSQSQCNKAAKMYCDIFPDSVTPKKNHCLGWYNFACASNSDCLTGFDCKTGTCAPDVEKNCADSNDDDKDGSVDCADSDCGAVPSCKKPSKEVALSCGATVSENIILTKDIYCNKVNPDSSKSYGLPGLRVAANDITIDCNGHKIVGWEGLDTGQYANLEEVVKISETAGIRFGNSYLFEGKFVQSGSYKGVTIKNCKIQGFVTGIKVSPYSDNVKILNNEITSVQTGISSSVLNGLEVSGNEVHNSAIGAMYNGIGIYGSNSVNAVYKNNLLQDTGIAMMISDFSATIENNQMIYSKLYGLRLAGPGKLTVKNNEMCYNTDADVLVYSSWSPFKKGDLEGNGNTLTTFKTVPTVFWTQGGGFDQPETDAGYFVKVIGWPVKGTNYKECVKA